MKEEEESWPLPDEDKEIILKYQNLKCEADYVFYDPTSNPSTRDASLVIWPEPVQMPACDANSVQPVQNSDFGA